MSRLLLMAGSPPLQALEARSYSAPEPRAYSAYAGCVSLDTSTASSIYDLYPSDPPTCATTCTDEYPYVAIQAEFCFCYPSVPEIFATFNDSDCSINCDYPYQDESCGGVTPGTLIDVYSFYTGSDYGTSEPPSDDGSTGSGISSPLASEQSPSPITQPGTTIGPTTTDQPSPGTPGPTAVVATDTYGASPPEGNAGITGTGAAATQIPNGASDSGLGDPNAEPPALATVATTETITTTYTVTLWTTVTSYATVYPGGPLQPTVVSSPAGITCITAEHFTSTYSPVTVTSTCHDGSVLTTVLPGNVRVMAYSPYVSEVREVEVEDGKTTTVLAAVVAAETANAGQVRRSEPTDDALAVEEPIQATSGTEQLTTAAPRPSGALSGTGWEATATGSQAFNASNTLSQLPVTAGTAGHGIDWQDRMMVLVFSVVVGAILSSL